MPVKTSVRKSTGGLAPRKALAKAPATRRFPDRSTRLRVQLRMRPDATVELMSDSSNNLFLESLSNRSFRDGDIIEIVDSTFLYVRSAKISDSAQVLSASQATHRFSIPFAPRDHPTQGHVHTPDAPHHPHWEIHAHNSRAKRTIWRETITRRPLNHYDPLAKK